MRRTAIVAAVALALPLLAGAKGCGIEPPVKCGWMSETADTDGRTAIIVDVSNSTRGVTASADGLDYAAALRTTLEKVVDARDTVAIGSFSGTDTDVDWVGTRWSLDWAKPDENEDNRGDRKVEARECVEDALRKAQTADPRQPGSDILRAMSNAAGWLKQTDGSRRLIVATDGLISTGCANLAMSGFAGAAEIAAISSFCQAEQEVRSDQLKDVAVTLVGVGHPGRGQKVPTAKQASWLGSLWHRLCADAGTTCALDETAIPGGPQTAAAVQRVGDPVVTYGGQVETRSFPAASLFATNSSVVRPDAIPTLVQAAVEIRGVAVKVVVRGYADPRGDARHNLALSTARAEAVMYVLRDNGVRNVTAVGKGETADCLPPELRTTADSQTEAALQCARRVDIVVTKD